VNEIVETEVGKVKGQLKDGVLVFKGIRYAKTPQGELRFKAPVATEGHTGIYEAFEFSPIAPQAPASPVTSIPGDPSLSDEDCLSLNIYCPEAEKLPVMIFIHGGGFVSGSSASQLYDATQLAKNNVIVVTINYRLGALGFLAAEFLADETGLNGNWGLADQLMAINWVRSNIEAFGGDPENITLFGESAGSMSIADLCTSPQSKNKFKKVICESGPPAAFDLENAYRQADRFFKALGIENPSLKALQEIPVEKIIEAQNKLAVGAAAFGLSFQPVVDGAFIPDDPRRIWNESAGCKVELLIGSNHDEMQLFAAGVPQLNDLDEENIAALIERIPRDMFKGNLRHPSEVFGYYKERSKEGEPAVNIWSAILTDWVFKIPSMAIAKANSGNMRSYLYRFDWKTDFLNGALGACHALELPFVFGTYTNPVIGFFAGSRQPGAADLSRHMQSYWTSFAKDGTPRSDASWPKYKQSDWQGTILDANCSVVDHLDEELYDLWVL
jgi:para-nitrobenzyl esterase